MESKTKKMVTVGMFCALAYIMTYVGRIPIVLFLKYDPKDIIVVIGGFVFGPFASFTISLMASVAQMFTNSGTGILGCIMNMISSCSFACPAAFVHKRKPTFAHAVAGILCGWGCMVAVMLLWNYLIAPFYMGYPREEIVKLLLPAFLPFNLIKGGINVLATMLLYGPIKAIMRRSHFLDK